MRAPTALSAALCAALALAAGGQPAWARSPVTIEGADEDVREAILDLLPDRDRPESLFEAERIAEEAAARASAWLRSEGYFAAEVTPEASETPARAQLRIAPGQRFVFDAPTLVFEGEAPSVEAAYAARAALNGVHIDAPARAESVLHGESGALTALQQAGYANATTGQRRVVADHATGRVAVEFRFNAGTAVLLGSLRADPDDLFRSSFVDDLRNWREGEGYTPQALAQLRRDMIATGAVSRANTHLEPPGPDGRSDVVLEVEPAHRNAYELGLSYSTTEGAGAVGKYTRRNFSHRADALAVSSTLSEMVQNIDVSLTRPHAAGIGHALRFGASAERETPDAFTREGVALYASVDAAARLHLSRSYGARLSVDHFNDLAGGVTDAVVLSSFLDLRHDTTDFTLDPHDGAVTDFRIEPSVSAGDETLGFVRGIADGRIYESFGRDDRLTLAARMRVGWLEPVAGSADSVPADRRFYAGGGGSVRGYDYNSIYPTERDALGLAPGGQGLLDGSLEARWRFGERFGGALFVDGGNAFDTWSDATDLRWGAGFGARYNLGFAPLRVDIAFPLNDRATQSGYALYISLGQAF